MQNYVHAERNSAAHSLDPLVKFAGEHYLARDWPDLDVPRNYGRRGNRLHPRWGFDRRGCRPGCRRRRRKVRASHTRRIRGIQGALGIEWTGGRSRRGGRCRWPHPVRAALTRGEPGILQASGIVGTSGQIGAELVGQDRRIGRCVGRRSRRSHGNNCQGHKHFRYPASSTRTAHLTSCARLCVIAGWTFAFRNAPVKPRCRGRRESCRRTAISEVQLRAIQRAFGVDAVCAVLFSGSATLRHEDTATARRTVTPWSDGQFAGGQAQRGKQQATARASEVGVSARRRPDDRSIGPLLVMPAGPESLQKVVFSAQTLEVGYKSLIYLLLACILPVWRW